MLGLGEHVAQGALQDALSEGVVVEQQVEQRAFGDVFALADDEAVVLQALEVGVQAGLLAELHAEVGQQGAVGHQGADAGGGRQGAVLAEHVVLIVALGVGGAGGLAFTLGQHDQRPQHHQQRDGVARQVDVVVAVEAGFAEHRRFSGAQQGDADVVGVEVVDQAQADLGQAILGGRPQVGVDQGALDLGVLAGQPAAGQQFGGQQGRVVQL